MACSTCIKLRKAAFAVIRTLTKGESPPKAVDENILRTRNDDVAPHAQ